MAKRWANLAQGNRLDVERVGAFERRFLDLASQLGLTVESFQVHEERVGDEPPTIEIALQQAAALPPDTAPGETRVAGHPNPRWTVERAQEHIAAAWWTLGQIGRNVGGPGQRPAFSVGTPEYHVQAIERLLEDLALTLPEEGHHA